MIPDEKLDELEREALAATPGPWFSAPFAYHEVGVYHARGSTSGTVDVSRTEIVARVPSRNRVHDAAHIAAADPQTVLDMVAELREARVRIAELEAKPRVRRVERQPFTFEDDG